MDTPQKIERLGPILLAPGISRNNAITKMYGAFIMVSMLTGMSFLQGYVLEVHLQIPRDQQGTISGDLVFWAEVVSIFLYNPLGVLGDRIGRRPVFALGILTTGIAYGLYPFATSVGELLVYRLIFGAGLAATAGMMSAITNDYPQEKSRGLFIGVTAMVNVLGVVFMASGIGRIPVLLTANEWDPVAAGQVMFLVAAGLCLLTSFICHLGLKGGTAVAPEDRENVRELFFSGMRAGKNPRVALAYAGAFASRSDLVIKGMFLALWAIHDGELRDMSPAEAMARFGLMIVIMQAASFIASPIFGWYIDQVNRVTSAIVALCFATVGYLSMYLITSPLDFAMAPYFILISFGSSFMLKTSLSLLGQEARPKERGSVFATAHIFGTIGIMIMVLVGGRTFDAWGPWAPFVIAGAYQSVLLVWAIVIRIKWPGPDMVGQRNWIPVFTAWVTAKVRPGKTSQR